MTLNPILKKVTERIIKRSETRRAEYLEVVRDAAQKGPARTHLSCSGQAHAYAASGADKDNLHNGLAGNLGIITAYNDMLSAHKPFESYPELLRQAAREFGGTAQVAGGVPAMCDGVTQGEKGMELSLFSRDVIALSSAVALSHDTFDAAVFLGVCDKIVPGLVIAAQSFGHLPAVFAPAGPMISGLSNDEKAKVRQKFASGEVGREELMKAEMAAYHGPGTCTFYGTANTNQMLMEFMGLHLPGSSFVPPNTDLRKELTKEAARRALSLSALGDSFTPVAHILDEKAFVNGIIGLHATGGSTNLLIHLIAMAGAGGIQLEWEDISELSEITPLLARVYPNGLADVNHFHAAGGLAYIIQELLSAGLLHDDTTTVAGAGLSHYTMEPVLNNGKLVWKDGAAKSHNDKILRTTSSPFQETGGLKRLTGNMGDAVIKISAVDPKHHIVVAPARVFDNQDDVKQAFKNGELTDDVIVVVRFQGPKANGMPELHSLMPLLSSLQARGQKVAIVTDGRMSGASGKVPAAIHVSPEASVGGPIAKIQDGDFIRLDAQQGLIEVLEQDVLERSPVEIDLTSSHRGTGRELFAAFRHIVNSADKGASIFGDFN